MSMDKDYKTCEEIQRLIRQGKKKKNTNGITHKKVLK